MGRTKMARRGGGDGGGGVAAAAVRAERTASAEVPRSAHGSPAQVTRLVRARVRLRRDRRPPPTASLGRRPTARPRGGVLGLGRDLRWLPQPRSPRRRPRRVERGALLAPPRLRLHLRHPHHHHHPLGRQPRMGRRPPRRRRRCRRLHRRRSRRRLRPRSQACGPRLCQTHPRLPVRRPPRLPRRLCLALPDARLLRHLLLLPPRHDPLRHQVARHKHLWLPRDLPLHRPRRPPPLHGSRLVLPSLSPPPRAAAAASAASRAACPRTLLPLGPPHQRPPSAYLVCRPGAGPCTTNHPRGNHLVSLRGPSDKPLRPV
mmetsp:Transcript_10433/g.33366  ORF Transcript_10433/g.33366 Transcript_10433/m.33366 type:complete len:316 (+) Transcript_10433:183-1130(+)